MERAVYKRESIQLKYDNKGKEKKETKVSKAGNGKKSNFFFTVNKFLIFLIILC